MLCSWQVSFDFLYFAFYCAFSRSYLCFVLLKSCALSKRRLNTVYTTTTTSNYRRRGPELSQYQFLTCTHSASFGRPGWETAFKWAMGIIQPIHCRSCFEQTLCLTIFVFVSLEQSKHLKGCSQHSQVPQPTCFWKSGGDPVYSQPWFRGWVTGLQDFLQKAKRPIFITTCTMAQGLHVYSGRRPLTLSGPYLMFARLVLGATGMKAPDHLVLLLIQ